MAYSISGTDADLFEIDQTTGDLRFKEAPFFSEPNDSDADNIYDVVLHATETYDDMESQNMAPLASLSTTVTTWHGDVTTEESLAKIIDGKTTADWEIHPQDEEGGKTITFDFPYLNGGHYMPTAFTFFNRVSCCHDRIDGSTVAFNLNGETQQEYTLNHPGGTVSTINVNQLDLLPFDQVVVTFSGGTQNFREIEIHAKPSVVAVSKELSISVNEATLNINAIQEDEIYYTNPITNDLRLGSSMPIKSITLYTISGQKVLNVEPNKSETTIDVSSLTQGVYIMNVDTASLQKKVKLIKR